jgi:hypothetical protein
VAQLVAHHTGSVGVRGSSPLSSTHFIRARGTWPPTENRVAATLVASWHRSRRASSVMGRGSRHDDDRAAALQTQLGPVHQADPARFGTPLSET